MCDYSAEYLDSVADQWLTYTCPHPKLAKQNTDGDGLCIFHSENAEKDLALFSEEFKKLYESGPHEFIGFVFPERFSFQELYEADDSLEFVDANFALVHFNCTADFRGVQFYGQGETNFSRAEFSGRGRTDFSGAQFSGQGGTNFSGAQFSGQRGTDFRRAEFTGGGTYFVSTEFSGQGGTNFSWAQFSGQGGTDFSFAEFSGEMGTFFGAVKFSVESVTNFKKALFANKNGTYITGCTFQSHTSFRYVKVKTYFSLENCIFHDYVEFIGSNKSEEEEANYIFNESSEVDFRNVTFLKPQNVIFNMVDLRKARFLNTDLLGVRMGQVDWQVEDNRYVVYDEKLVDKEDINDKDDVAVKENINDKDDDADKDIVTHREVAHLYKQLRSVYESTGRYFEAGDFFYGEMEMRRKQKGPREGRFLQVLLWLYRLISYYGERPLRALAWLGGTILFFTPLYFFFGLRSKPNAVESEFIRYKLAFAKPDIEFWSDLVKTFFYSISNFTLGRTFTDLAPLNNWSTGFSILESIIGVVIITLFALSINRKLKRTKD